MRYGALTTLVVLGLTQSRVLADQAIKGSLSTTQAYAFLGSQQELSLSQYDASIRAKAKGKYCDANLNLRLRSDDGRSDSMLTLLAIRAFDQDQTHLQLFAAQDIENGGDWFSANVKHQFTPSWNIGLRADTFAGPENSIFGRIKAQDRLSITATKTFYRLAT